MSLKSKNPTKTNSWNKLNKHFIEMRDVHINDMFKDDINRGGELSVKWQDFYFDF